MQGFCCGFYCTMIAHPEQRGFSAQPVPGESATKSEQMPWVEMGQTCPAQLWVLPKCLSEARGGHEDAVRVARDWD